MSGSELDHPFIDDLILLFVTVVVTLVNIEKLYLLNLIIQTAKLVVLSVTI